MFGTNHVRYISIYKVELYRHVREGIQYYYYTVSNLF